MFLDNLEIEYRLNVLVMFWLIVIIGLYFFRGNYESKSMNKIYGFEGEVNLKFNDIMVKLFVEMFCYLLLVNVLNKKVFVVYGGFFSSDGVKLFDIFVIDWFREFLDEGMCIFLVVFYIWLFVKFFELKVGFVLLVIL